MPKEELKRIASLSMPFPAKVIRAYAKMGPTFTSGDLSRESGIPRSTAKFYLRKMVELRMVTKLPGRKKYQKYANAMRFSDWLKDLRRLAIVPIESGEL